MSWAVPTLHPGHPGLVDCVAVRDSVGPDHAELVACRVLQHSCRPLAGLCGRNGSRARDDHLGDHRRGVFDEQIEVGSDLRGLRFGNPLEGHVRWPVGAAGPVDRDVRRTSTVRTSHVAEELLPEGGQLMGSGQSMVIEIFTCPSLLQWVWG